MKKYQNKYSKLIFDEGDINKLYGAIYKHYSLPFNIVKKSKWFKDNFIEIKK